MPKQTCWGKFKVLCGCAKAPPDPVKDLYENEFFVVNLKVLNELSKKMTDHDVNHRQITYLDLIDKLG